MSAATEEKLFEEKLNALKTGLEATTKEEAEKAVADFQKRFEENYAEKTKELVGEELKEYKSKAEQISNGLDELKEITAKMDAKMKEVDFQKKGKPESFEKRLSGWLTENKDQVLNIRGKKVFGPEQIKAVGNMTTANLTGDEEREYSREVVMVPGRLTHFVDLCGPDINIGVGTYTFPSESGSEGAIATQTEGSDKGQIDYDFTNNDVATDFIAGFAVYSKKMRNNLPFLTSFLPGALRRDYMNAEDGVFNTALAAAATASTQIITSNTKIGMLFGELATLAGANHVPNAVVMKPADYYDLLQFEKSTGAGYGLPMGTTVDDSGQIRFLGIPVGWVNWLADNKYYVGDWSRINRVVTEGLSLEFSEHDEDNFRKNNITARIEAQVGIAIHQPSAVIYGDFTAT